MKVLVGCCGFAGSMQRYFKTFLIVEVQQTFYKIPQLKTLQRWRLQAPENFQFTVKCFQGVTHTVTSPTWRRYGKISGKNENYGFLQPTREVFDFWEQTIEAAKALNSEVVIIQTPTGFKDDPTNIENASRFFTRASKDIQIAFEPRGWKEESIQKTCKKFDLIHCVDPFAARPTWLGKSKVAYLRLHGSPPGQRMYSYKYREKDLQNLKSLVEAIKAEIVHIMFNNISMFDDALAFMRMI